MFFAGRIETKGVQRNSCLLVASGLDTADERRLLDQRFNMVR